MLRSKQYTHGILNITDVHLMNNNEISKVLVDAGGEKVRGACDKHIQENGPLDVGDVISLPSGNLRYFCLFHTALSKSYTGTPEKDTLASALSAAFTKACAQKCKSLSIPAVKFNQKTVLEIVSNLLEIMSKSSNDVAHNLEVIRIVGTSRTAYPKILS